MEEERKLEENVNVETKPNKKILQVIGWAFFIVLSIIMIKFLGWGSIILLIAFFLLP